MFPGLQCSLGVLEVRPIRSAYDNELYFRVAQYVVYSSVYSNGHSESFLHLAAFRGRIALENGAQVEVVWQGEEEGNVECKACKPYAEHTGLDWSHRSLSRRAHHDKGLQVLLGPRLPASD